MFFTWIGRTLAYLAVTLGTFRLVVGIIAVATDNQAMVARYLGSGTAAEAIDRSFLVIVAGIVLGILTDISRSVKR